MENENKNGPMPFLSVKDLVVEYTSEGEIIHAVNGVSFDLEKGRTLGLVGETGAGKTSIAKAILRILPDPPAKIRSGRIYLEGTDLLALKEEEMCKVRGKRVSMVYQDPMTALNPVMRIGNQIAEGIKLHSHVSRVESLKRAKSMLEMVGITAERYREYPHQFSGGMQQRVVIAMALACSPDLLLADEPTTALDVTIQAQALDMINKLKMNKNMAMIMITHDMGVVAAVCDDVAVVYAGEIIEYGPKEELFDHPSHPYTVGLFGAIPDIKTDEHRLHPIEGLPPNPSDLPKGCNFSPRCPYVMKECHENKATFKPLGNGHFCRCHKTPIPS
ncbi:MAG: ABC transporter ATP-binding protein [Treponema sp.]|jgi:peptide/nickel transport system ATP-binding protein|nr:ABC transporter ATP-binding protein [Treponema sp.]